MRALLFFLLLAGCAQPVTRNDSEVDLNGAAERAQDNTGAVANKDAPAPLPVARPPAAARYRCMDGSKIALRFDAAGNTLALSRDGKAVATLTAHKPMVGWLYANGTWRISGEGDMATVTAPGQPPIACKLIG